MLKIKENLLDGHLIVTFWVQKKIIYCKVTTFFMGIFTAVEACSHISTSVLMTHGEKTTLFGAFLLLSTC